MKPARTLCLSLLALILAEPAARAGDGAHEQATRLGEHPAVLIARHGVQTDPTASFYLHPARLSWSLRRPLSDGEHPAVLVARHESSSKIDPNGFIVGHPAGGAPASRTQ